MPIITTEELFNSDNQITGNILIDRQNQPKRIISTEELFADEQPQNPNLLTKPIETLAKSGSEFVGNIFSAIGHPIQTIKAVGKTALGGVQKLIPGEQGDEQYFNNLADFYTQRYGGLDKARKTALEDPIGFASDVSIFLTGGGAAALKTGQIMGIARLAKAGKLIGEAGQMVDPLRVVTVGAGKGLEKATAGRKIAPFAKTLDQPAIQAAKEAGVELPASAKVTNRAVPAIETLAGKGFFGDDIIKKVETAQVQLNKYADNIVSKTGQSPDLTSAGQAIFKGADLYRNNFIKIKNDLYNKALIPRKGEGLVTVNPTLSIHTGATGRTSTVDFVNSVLLDKKGASKLLGSSTDIGYFNNLFKKLSVGNKRPLNGKFYQSAIRELNSKMNNISDPIVTGNKGTLKKLATLMSEDLDNAIAMQRPELVPVIKKANKFYSEGISKLNSTYGEKIFDLADKGQYDKIVPAIVSSSTSIDDIPKIYEIIGKQNVPALQSAFLEDFFKKARNVNGNFTPSGITQQINKFRTDKLQAILTPEQFKAVKNIEQIARGMGKAEKIAGGSQTAYLGRIFGEVALFTQNPWLGFKAVVGDLLASKFIASKEGQALLAEGLTLTGRRGRQLQGISSKAGKIGGVTRLGSIIRENQ